ncbi:DUF6707 family protein [Hymenobacter volaticus]|uniref:Tetracyclin repressor-like C-terminal domain-containing protein n=1 Tax=Hymenobacter volaticus TaxID=2932254 RepID=A0ABY4GFU4_9BACT|nr:DUF6707 family protein [Hymenobacter volaticus]UOQ69189.1 hypothetical protein MUN86_26100 [Hymenobacter volaticus]
MSKTLDDKRQVLAAVATHLPTYSRLARLATSLAKTFKPTVAAALARAKTLAYWLYVYEQPALCLQVCQLLNDIPFEQDYNRWTWVEATLALEWKLRLEAGESIAAHACVAAMQATSALEDPAVQKMNAAARNYRLTGGLLADAQIAEAELFGDKMSATAYRLTQLGELLFIQAHGGSAALPVPELEQRFTAHLATLRAACGLSQA